MQVGEQVTSRHGETLTVLELRTIPAKMKRDKVVRPEQHMFLAQSGGSKCWFSYSVKPQPTEGGTN